MATQVPPLFVDVYPDGSDKAGRGGRSPDKCQVMAWLEVEESESIRLVPMVLDCESSDVIDVRHYIHINYEEGVADYIVREGIKLTQELKEVEGHGKGNFIRILWL
jgi:hypothetical protein